MFDSRVRTLLCTECSLPMSAEDGHHYVYHCHACAMAEHDLILAVGRDPDHPDGWRLTAGPVDLGIVCRREAQA